MLRRGFVLRAESAACDERNLDHPEIPITDNVVHPWPGLDETGMEPETLSALAEAALRRFAPPIPGPERFPACASHRFRAPSHPPIMSLTIYIINNIYVRMSNDTASAVERFLPLKPNWFHVLLSLASEEQHGYGIMQEVLERTNGKIRLWPATLYGTLERLLDEGLIAEASRRPLADEDDARRRYYRLTAQGRRVLAAESIRLEDLVRVIRAKRRAARSEA